MDSSDSEGFVGYAHGLVGRSVVLHPMRPKYLDFLCEMALTGEVAWPWGGMPETAETFSQTVTARLLCQFVPVQRRSGMPCGLVRASEPNLFHGHVYLSACFAVPYRKGREVVESLILFVDHCIRRYGFRKLYAVILEPDAEAFTSGASRYFEIEARLKDWAYSAGGFVDKLIFTVGAERWKNDRWVLVRLVRRS